MASSLYLCVILLLSGFTSGVLGKECTNTPTQLSSHTLRSQLLSSENASQGGEDHLQFKHLIPSDDSQWSKLFPRKVLKEVAEEELFDWALLYRRLKNSGGSKGLGSLNLLKEVSLHDVRLEPESLHGRAQQTNLEYLLLLDVDRLVWSFRKTAELPTPGTAYGGWENPTSELRGHFVGHYLSAAAQMWASTHNVTLHTKMSSVISALSACQVATGTGYLSAFPSEEFDRFEAIKPVWAPYYTIHKILAGLLDQFTFAGNNEALKMMLWMVDYFNNRVQNLISKYSVERHWLSLNEETGGMNDVLYKLYSITGDAKHLVLAHLFDKPCFLGLLAVQADSLSGFHANTHIPIVIGSQMRYEVTGDPLYKEIGTYFMDIVNSSHAYATGGTSVGEFWSDPKHLATTLETENEESCTTYNMLKVSRHLFRWTKEMAYADYYERALTNGVLGTQRGREPGVMIYMLPLGRGDSKARTYHGWGTKFDSFWCCYGTGIESFSKLGDSIYFEEKGNIPVLYVIQFISSSFNWKSGQFELNQTVEPVVSWDPFLRVTFTLSPTEGANNQSTLNLRIPSWTHSIGSKATLNAKNLSFPSPGNFLSVTKEWNFSDKLTLQLPLSLRVENIKDDRPEYSSIRAFLYGPYLLAGLTAGDWNIKIGSSESLSDWISPVPATYNSQLISLTQDSDNHTLVLTNSNSSITMEKLSKSGTDSAVHSTFRILSTDSKLQVSSQIDIIGKAVMLEPFDLPGMVIVQQGIYKSLIVVRSGSDGGDEKLSIFRAVPGLDGKADTISLESDGRKGCYMSTGLNYKAGTAVQLSCSSQKKALNDEFLAAASFTLGRGVLEYHPVSFVAKGTERNFLLQPLLSLRDESYSVYFNIEA